MSLLHVMIYFSSASFLAYGVSYFVTPHMKNEFKRFGLERYGPLTVFLEILGAVGLLVGLFVNSVLLISSGGLTILMFLGLLVRFRNKDRFQESLPALFLMLLNASIFFTATFP